MVPGMRDTKLRERNMAMANMEWQMGACMKVNSLKMLFKDMENINGQMEEHTRENGIKIR